LGEENTDLICDGSAVLPEHHRKYWRGKSFWRHPREIGKELDQRLGGVMISPILLDPALV